MKLDIPDDCPEEYGYYHDLYMGDMMEEEVAVVSFKKKLCIVLIVLAFIIFRIFIYPWLAFYAGFMMLENPPEPEIEHGEFSFELIYEINGERKEIKDTIVCDYDGIDADTSRGKYRVWKAKLKSGGTEIILWRGKDSKGRKQEIFYNYESPGYYMGDPEYKYGNAGNPSNVILRKYFRESIVEPFISKKKLYEKYHIKIISWECEEPIGNAFS